MRISGLFGPVIALVALTPIAPAHADISAGDLMYTDLFRWQGQDGTPTWREILAKFDCTEELTFYLWNTPSPSRPIIIPPTPAIDPVIAAPLPPLYGDPVDPMGPPDGGAGSGTTVLVDPPIGTPGGGTPGFPGASTTVPETSTWVMLLLGFAGLGYAAVRRGRASRGLRIAN